jgi:hypothetical protein
VSVPTGVTYTVACGTSDGATVQIPAGTFAGSTTLTIQRFASDPAPSPSVAVFAVLGTAYQIDAAGMTFNPGQTVTLTFPYDPVALALAGKSPSSLTMAYYDGVQWAELPGSVDTVAHTVTVHTSHFSVWAVVVKATPAVAAPPAGVSGFFVNPVVRQGEDLCAAPAKPLSDSHWQVFNLRGQTVAKLDQAGPSVCLQTGGIAPGVYFLKATSSFSDGSAGDDLKKIVILP